jgi:lipopolysaccharide export system protein LptA
MKNITPKILAGLFAALSIGAVSIPLASAQTPAANNAPTNAFKGFAGNRKDPVKIEANSLEVRDKEKAAVFIGNVVVTQGDTVMRSRELTVYYEGNALGMDRKQNPPATKTQQKDAAAQRIKRLVAVGGVIVTSKDQKATGDRGVFEMATNIVTLTGNVIITQCQNVMRGEKLTVDLNTNLSKLDGNKATPNAQPRVQGLFVPNSDDKKNKAGKDAKDTKDKNCAATTAADQKDRPAAKKQKQTTN